MRNGNLLLSATLMVGTIFGVSVANAADMAVKAPPPVAVYNWTGCYIGVEGGGQWGTARSVGTGLRNGVRVGPGGNLNNQTDFDGGLGGGTLGCNYEVNRWVLGIEGDGSWSSISGSSSLVPPVFNPNFREAFGDHWLATVRGRVGYAVKDDMLLYGTAGGAFADLRVNEFNIGNVISITDTKPSPAGPRRRRGVGLCPGLVRQDRISLSRPRHQELFCVYASGVHRAEYALDRQHRARWRQLSLQLGRAGRREILSFSPSPATTRSPRRCLGLFASFRYLA